MELKWPLLAITLLKKNFFQHLQKFHDYSTTLLSPLISYLGPVFYFVNWKSRDNFSIFSYFSLFSLTFQKGHLTYVMCCWPFSISVESNQNSRTNIPHCLPNSMLTRYFLQYNINSSRQTHFPDNLQSISTHCTLEHIVQCIQCR